MDINQIIKEKAGLLTDKELTKFINLSVGGSYKISAIKKRRQRLGIKKACGRGLCSVLKTGVSHVNSTV